MKTNIGCVNFKGIAVAYANETHKVAQLRCKQWSCSYCALQNAKQWRAALLEYINTHDSEWSFITVTMPAWIHKKQEHDRYETSLLHLQKHWDSLMKRLKRYLGKFEYIRVIETHKSGVIHVHLLLSVAIPDCRIVYRKDKEKSFYWTQDIIKKHITDCNFGYIHDIRCLLDNSNPDHEKYHAGSVAAYITKYITKDLSYDDATRRELRVRKIQTSRGIKRITVDSDVTWSLKSGIYIDEFLARQKPTHDVTTGRVVTIESFRGSYVYPPEIDLSDEIE